MDSLSALTLAQPLWLLLVAVAAPLLLLAPRLQSADDAVPFRRVRTGLKLLALGLVSIALARPTLREQRRDVQVVALVDVSESVGPAALEAERHYLQIVERAVAARGVSLRALRFAGEAVEIVPAAGAAVADTLPRFPPPVGRDTDFAQALGLALGLVDPGTLPRILVLSDGRPTRGDTLAAVERAAARGVRLFFRAAHETATADTAVLRLDGPEIVRPRATFDLEATIVATGEGRARVRLLRQGRPVEDAAGERPEDGGAERQITLRPGLNRVRWKTRLETSEPTVYAAEIVEATPNTHRENDRAMTVIVPERRPRVLLIDTQGGAGPFAQALQVNEIEVERKGVAGLGSGEAGRQAMASFDLVVLSDIAPSTLKEAQLRVLDAFVREGGGGLLVAGATATFGSGALNGTRLEPLLPVREDAAGEQQEPTLALGLVIDRSGSMSGPKMELTKDAARGAAELLGPLDLITVVVFDSQAHTVVRLQPASNRQRILGDIAQIRASGGTNILPGMREAFEQLLPARARKKHMIVLSDGQSPAEGVQELVDEAAAARVTVSAVGVGEGADLALLQTIAGRGGGRFYHARDPSTLPRIFTRETADMVRSTVVERPTPLVAGRRAEALAGLGLGSAPALAGFTRTRARRESEVLVETPGGEPLLARWQVGVGQVAAWTTDLGGRYAAAFSRWSAFPKLWAQVARSLMRRQATNRLPLYLALEGDRVLARVEARSDTGRPLVGLAGELTITPIGQDVTALTALPPERGRVPLVEESAGSYTAELERGEAAVLLATARLWPAAAERTASPLAEGRGRVSVPLAAELLPLLPETLHGATGGQQPSAPTGRALLAALAARTGGRELGDDPAPLLDPGTDQAPHERPLRSPVILAALLVFLVELGLRRANFRRPGKGVKVRPTPLPAAEPV